MNSCPALLCQRLSCVASLAFGVTAAMSVAATDIPLASTMNTDGRISEFGLTGSYAEIGLDPNGLYSVVDDAPFGPIELFPNDAAFNIGSITVDDSSITGSGIEIAPITGLDMSALSGTPTSDISSTGLANWFFSAPNFFSFGPLDAFDVATFTDGVLTSLDLEVTSAFNIFDASGSGVPLSLDGTLTIVGDQITFAYSDTEQFETGFGLAPFIFATSDLNGTVDAVGSFVIPEPATVALLALGVTALYGRRGNARLAR
ncbi:MAG: PEP-CTERM sorting domain-containing protein [Planctomycetota bacterium]